MSTDVAQLGKISEGDPGDRDAIHIAIISVVAAEKLYPCQDVALVPDDVSRVCASGTHVGIIDPFLKSPVMPDQMCWLLLYPNTITGLSHHWTHPAFDAVKQAATTEEQPLGDSEQWLRELADKAGMSYDRFIDIVTDYAKTGEVWVEHGSERARDAYYGVDPELFWKHFERVTGIAKSEDWDWNAPFSCSC